MERIGIRPNAIAARAPSWWGDTSSGRHAQTYNTRVQSKVVVGAKDSVNLTTVDASE